MTLGVMIICDGHGHQRWPSVTDGSTICFLKLKKVDQLVVVVVELCNIDMYSRLYCTEAITLCCAVHSLYSSTVVILPASLLDSMHWDP